MTPIAVRIGRHLALLAAGLLLLAGSAGGAATAPTALTGPVNGVGPTTATVTGTVDPNGSATSWQFEYGLTTTYGSKTTAVSAGAGTVNTQVTGSLTGLTPGTTYHYRLDASNSGGTALGIDGLFTTGQPSGGTTSTASNVTTSAATLNGTVQVAGLGTTYFFEYGKTTSYGKKTATTDAGTTLGTLTVTASITGLVANQIYHFRLVIVSNGVKSDAADQSFTTAAPAAIAPTVTTSAATAIGASSAKLNGTVNANGQATTWYFEFGSSSTYGSKTPEASVGTGTHPTRVSATVNGLPAGVYHFRLVATNATGTTDGADQSFGSGAPIVQTGTTQGATTSTATLTGSVNPIGNPTSWYFEYGTTTSYGSKTPSRSAGSSSAVTGVSAAIANLTAGTTYHYRLVAKSKTGITDGSDVTFTTVAAVTISAPSFQTIYGQYVTLSGGVASKQPGVSVTIAAEPYGTTAYTAVGTVLTGAGGGWTFQAKPTLGTAYEATVTQGPSSSVTIGVAPAISLRVITKARFSTRVVAGASFAGKRVQLQREVTGGAWVTVAHAQLNGKSSAIFPASKLPLGASTIRIALSVKEAGPGYIAGYSRSLTYRRS